MVSLEMQNAVERIYRLAVREGLTSHQVTQLINERYIVEYQDSKKGTIED